MKGVRDLLKSVEEFDEIIEDIISNETVQKMKNYRQHYDISCFEHCKNVAYISYKICKKLKLDYKAAARAGMLHDMFLYDWRIKQEGMKGFHAIKHPRVALENSKKLFELSNREQDIILKHMWPLTIKLPSYPESFIITIVDKYSAISEGFSYYVRRLRFGKKVDLHN